MSKDVAAGEGSMRTTLRPLMALSICIPELNRVSVMLKRGISDSELEIARLFVLLVPSRVLAEGEKGFGPVPPRR